MNSTMKPECNNQMIDNTYFFFLTFCNYCKLFAFRLCAQQYLRE